MSKSDLVNGGDLLGNQVNMSNLAARAAHGFSLREKRLFAAGLSQLDSRKPRSAYLSLKQRTVRVHARDYAALAEVDEASSYKDMHAACEHLFNRYLRYEIMTSRGLKERKIRWVGGLTYHHGEGWVEFGFTEEIMPHLADLRQQFTQYRLGQTCGLRSIYSWRLLELLTSYASKDGTGTKVILLDKFRQALEIPKSYRFSNIKQRVIEPAITELQDKDGWLIQWFPEKKGRKIVAVKFVWKRDPQRRLELDDSKTKKKKSSRLPRSEIEKQARPGETWEQAEVRLRKLRAIPPKK